MATIRAWAVASLRPMAIVRSKAIGNYSGGTDLNHYYYRGY